MIIVDEFATELEIEFVEKFDAGEDFFFLEFEIFF